jgi:hypothetical protein
MPDPHAQVEDAQQDRADGNGGGHLAPAPPLAQIPDGGDDHEPLQRHGDGRLVTGPRGGGRADEEQEERRQQQAETAAGQGGAAGRRGHRGVPSVAAVSAGIR